MAAAAVACLQTRRCLLLAASCVLMSCSATKENYVERGDRLRAAGHPADAAINYRKAIQKDPAYGLAYYRLGLLQLSQKDPAGAYRSLTTANSHLRGNPDVKVALADLTLGIYLGDT